MGAYSRFSQCIAARSVNIKQHGRAHVKYVALRSRGINGSVKSGIERHVGKYFVKKA